MTVRVRFAPSPTGYLHIGGVRTALFCYLFAKVHQGVFVLRIEDTDLARSKREYEEAMISDLKWLNISHDEGPDVSGDFGPYRQSERLNIYQECAQQLLEEEKAFYCFCSDAELEEYKEAAMSEGRSPHYNGKCRHLGLQVSRQRLAAGEKAAIRFKAPFKDYSFNDMIRDNVHFPADMVGDFIILRSDGVPVYNYCCVVDDWKMQMSHVIRAEEHLPNTLRQLMLYEAFGVTPPLFAHVSLLVGNDRQKLSKRHGATAVSAFREQTFLPQAMINYLALLGWSHPEEKDIFTLQELEKIFTLERVNKSPAVFDTEKFTWVNGQHLRQLDSATLVQEISPWIAKDHPFHRQSIQWKLACVELFKIKIEFFKEIIPYLDALFNPHISLDGLGTEEKEVLNWESTPKLGQFLLEQLKNFQDEYITEEVFLGWQNMAKTQLQVKGKSLFMGMRVLLTGTAHGSELKNLVGLTPVSVLRSRVEALSGVK